MLSSKISRVECKTMQNMNKKKSEQTYLLDIGGRMFILYVFYLCWVHVQVYVCLLLGEPKKKQDT